MDFKTIENNEVRLKLIIQFRELILLEESNPSPHKGRINMLMTLKNGLKFDFINQKYLLN